MTLLDQAVGIIRWIAQPSLAQLMLRLALAVPFWKSGILKWNGFLQLNDTTIYLFTEEFKLHLPGGPYDFPAPAAKAFLSGCGEIIFPVLLVLGFGTRFAALGLLFMTCIVELTVPDGWPIHLTWAAMALGIMACGPGRLCAPSAAGIVCQRELMPGSAPWRGSPCAAFSVSKSYQQHVIRPAFRSS